MSLGAEFVAFDARLAAGGVPLCSDYWRGVAVDFYDDPTARMLVGQVGRGGNKSTFSAKSLTFEAVVLPWTVPAGERHWAINVSENLGEAMARQGQIAEYLSILGLRFERSGEQLILSDLPLGFWTRAARIGALKGPRVVAWSVDETASLSIEGVNPSREIIASLRAATITHPGARGRALSSPWGTASYHYELVERGNTTEQRVCKAPSWIANPAVITEQRSHELEPDLRVWRREYLAEASGSGAGAFEPDHVERMLTRSTLDACGYAHRPIITLDASSMRGDGFVSAVAQWVVPDLDRTLAEFPEVYRGPVDGHGRRIVGAYDYDDFARPIVDPEHGWRLRPCLMVSAITTHAPTLAADEVADAIACIARDYDALEVVGDQHGAYGWTALLGRYGLRFREVTWTSPRKSEAVYQLRAWMRDGLIAVPSDASDRAELEAFRKEALAYEERLTSAGNATYSAPRGFHDDRVAAALMTSAMADAEGLIPGSPYARANGRNTGDSHSLDSRLGSPTSD